MGENTSKAVHDTYGNIQYNLKQDNCNLCVWGHGLELPLKTQI